MAEVSPAKELTQQETSARTNALIAYGCLLLGLFTGVFWFLGGLWGMISRRNAEGTVFKEHFDIIVRTFMWGLAFSLLAVTIFIHPVFWLLVVIAWLWLLFRLLKGILRAGANKPYNG